MEILAENRFHLTRALFFEGMARISRDTYGKWARKFTLVFLIVWAVMAILLLCIGGTIGQALIYLALVAVICLWLNLLAPRSQAKKAWKALVSRCGEDPERITRFYGEHLEIDAGGALKTIPYTDILEIKQTKGLLVLVCADKVGVMAAKDGFVSGSAENVLALLQGAQYKGV